MSTVKSRLIRMGLGFAMLGTVIAAALSPNIGAVAAQTNCQYSACTSGGPPMIPWWFLVGIVIIVAALIIGLFIILRRPRSPPKESTPE